MSEADQLRGAERDAVWAPQSVEAGFVLSALVRPRGGHGLGGEAVNATCPKCGENATEARQKFTAALRPGGLLADAGNVYAHADFWAVHSRGGVCELNFEQWTALREALGDYSLPALPKP